MAFNRAHASAKAADVAELLVLKQIPDNTTTHAEYFVGLSQLPSNGNLNAVLTLL